MLAAPKSERLTGFCFGPIAAFTIVIIQGRQHPKECTRNSNALHVRFIRSFLSQAHGRCHCQHLLLLPVSPSCRRRTSISTCDPFLALCFASIPTGSLSPTLYRFSSSAIGLSSDRFTLVYSSQLRHIRQWLPPPPHPPPPPLLR